jgi:arabinogalactan endo-1,4-beta-galactosidase
MRLMIDFHYSDFWADPGKQNPPEAWKEYDIAQMADAVSGHTYDILKSLKDNKIDIEWVQLGNEVNNGMLWPLGKVQGSTAGNFIRLINLGYDIVKDLYPEAKVILHVSNGHDAGLFDWFFNLMHSGKARYDMIGMSLYPSWWENGGLTPWKPVVDKCMANIKSISTKINKPVILCEVGMPVSEPQTAKEALLYILDQIRAIEGCHGVFYWEPQTDGVWKPSSYEDLGWGAYDMGAFRNGRPTAALDPFGN